MSLGLALWILVAPLDLAGEWGWTIIAGPYESAAECRDAKASRLDGARLLCAQLK